MFEKEAEEYFEKECLHSYADTEEELKEDVMAAFKSGAEFGYNKANEWNYPSKGEYPNDFEDVLICFLTEDDAKDCVRGWYEYDFENDKHIFKYLNVLEIQCLKTVFAWKKLVLPELPKEIK